jgi:ABC-type arginine transport system ATPase subunit
MAFITENRRDEGLLLTKNISDNISLVNLNKLRKRLGRLDRKQQAADCRRVIERLRIKTAAENRQLAKHLSGGNQQKTVIGKWLLIRRTSSFWTSRPAAWTWAQSLKFTPTSTSWRWRARPFSSSPARWRN